MPNDEQKKVKIRMYRQGLGDCFLLTFPRQPKPFYMRIDCGALNSKHYDADLMKQVVHDIQEATGGHLDAVVATHEHWDHISGFLQAKETFDEMNVQEVWVAWTEDRNSTAAKRIKAEFQKRKQAVELGLARFPDPMQGSQLGLYKRAITELLGFYGELGVKDGKGKTEAAWDYLLGLGRNVYCYPKQPPLPLNGVEGVHVYILGPPEDPEFLRKRQSTKETYQDSQPRFSLIDSFLAAVTGDAANPELWERAIPFDGGYRIAKKTAKKMKFFKNHYGFAEGDADAWRRIDHDWLTMTGELALQLDSYTNNTCLALAIELVESGKVLLFPGDAQVGNWLSWAELSWQVKDAAGQSQQVTPDALLARTAFYKVGHHGSHNATLRAKGLEKMDSPELVAMIPVHRETAQDQDWEFPYPPLWKQLQVKARGRVLLADAKDGSDIEQEVRVRLSPAECKSFQGATTYSDLYIEYRIAY